MGFTGLLKKFVNMSDVAVPVSIIEENSPQGPGGAFTAGSNKASGFSFFSDAFVADANGKLFRQNAYIHHVAPETTKGVAEVPCVSGGAEEQVADVSSVSAVQGGGFSSGMLLV